MKKREEREEREGAGGGIRRSSTYLHAKAMKMTRGKW